MSTLIRCTQEAADQRNHLSRLYELETRYRSIFFFQPTNLQGSSLNVLRPGTSRQLDAHNNSTTEAVHEQDRAERWRCHGSCFFWNGVAGQSERPGAAISPHAAVSISARSPDAARRRRRPLGRQMLDPDQRQLEQPLLGLLGRLPPSQAIVKPRSTPGSRKLLRGSAEPDPAEPALAADVLRPLPCYLLTTAAPTVQIASSCDPVPPEQPMAPMILPPSISGMPPRDAMASSRLKMYLKSNFCTASSNALVGRRNLAAVRALCSAMGIEASCAPSIRRKATRLAPESTTATLIGQPFLVASATAS